MRYLGRYTFGQTNSSKLVLDFYYSFFSADLTNLTLLIPLAPWKSIRLQQSFSSRLGFGWSSDLSSLSLDNKVNEGAGKWHLSNIFYSFE